MKRIIFILSLITFNFQLLTFNLVAQPVQQEWVARYVRTSGTGNYGGPFFALDRFGNSHVAGINNINDSINILAVKYNSSGIQQWATLYKYPGEGYFVPSALALDSSGNVYVTSEYGQDIFHNLNILTVKFSALNGSVAWAKRYIGQYGSSEPRDLKIDKLNNIYVVGWADSTLLCLKYDTNGDTIWVRKYHPAGDFAYGYACTIDDSLNIIATGRRCHFVSFPPPGTCFDTVLTIKYSTDGVLKWMSTYHYDNLANEGIKITTDQDGSAYIAGRTRISGLYVYLTLKYDRNGIQQWASIYNGPGNGDDDISSMVMDRSRNFVFVTGRNVVSSSQAYYATIKYYATNGDSAAVMRYGANNYISGSKDIKVDTSGNSYITGGSGPFNSTQDIVTIRYSPQGNQDWLATYNGPANAGDMGVALDLDNFNDVYVCGGSQGDYIVIKYSQLSGITPLSNQLPLQFKLHQNYPNPFNPETIINYEIPITNFVKLIVYDILGRQAATLVNEKQHAGSYEVRFDGSNYSSGVYFYKLISDGNTIDTKKLVLLK